jgi:hypothetical protein
MQHLRQDHLCCRLVPCAASFVWWPQLHQPPACSPQAGTCPPDAGQPVEGKQRARRNGALYDGRHHTGTHAHLLEPTQHPEANSALQVEIMACSTHACTNSIFLPPLTICAMYAQLFFADASLSPGTREPQGTWNVAMACDGRIMFWGC